MNALLELAARVEAAEGPDHDLTEAIARAVGGDIRTGPILPDHAPRGFYAGLAYTYSIDAALSLVDDATFLHLSRYSPDEGGPSAEAHVYPNRSLGDDYTGHAATLPLAICAAALKARAAQSDAPLDPPQVLKPHPDRGEMK